MAIEVVQSNSGVRPDKLNKTLIVNEPVLDILALIDGRFRPNTSESLRI
jgi:hypothetical protein